MQAGNDLYMPVFHQNEFVTEMQFSFLCLTC